MRLCDVKWIMAPVAVILSKTHETYLYLINIFKHLWSRWQRTATNLYYKGPAEILAQFPARA